MNLPNLATSFSSPIHSLPHKKSTEGEGSANQTCGLLFLWAHACLFRPTCTLNHLYVPVPLTHPYPPLPSFISAVNTHPFMHACACSFMLIKTFIHVPSSLCACTHSFCSESLFAHALVCPQPHALVEACHHLCLPLSMFIHTCSFTSVSICAPFLVCPHS